MRFGNVWNMNLTWSTSSLGLDHFDVYAYIIVVASKSYALEMCVWKKTALYNVVWEIYNKHYGVINGHLGESTFHRLMTK